jgi:hypothetical protein
MILKQAQEILQRMLGPMPLDTFLDDVLGKRFVKLEGKLCAEPRSDLLGENPEQAILAAFSNLAPKIGYHAAAPSGPPPSIEPVADTLAFKAKIEAFHALGYTVRIPEIQTLTPELGRFIRALELLFQTPVKAQAFWGRGDARAPVHHDDYDLIVVHLRGRKRWFISTDPSDLPNIWRTIPEQPESLERYVEVDVEPGDLLYLPRGTVHRVDAVSDSIHASIGFVPLTLREAIIACLDHLSDLSLPLRETVGARLAAQIQASDFGNLAGRVRDGMALLASQCKTDAFVAGALQRRSSRIIGDLAKLSEPTGRITLSPATRMRHSPLGVCHLSGSASKIDFAYPGGHHYIHRGAEQGIAFIAHTPEFRIRDIPGAVGDDVRMALVEQLLSSGFLEVAAE